jgi:hypothetical protein
MKRNAAERIHVRPGSGGKNARLTSTAWQTRYRPAFPPTALHHRNRLASAGASARIKRENSPARRPRTTYETNTDVRELRRAVVSRECSSRPRGILFQLRPHSKDSRADTTSQTATRANRRASRQDFVPEGRASIAAGRASRYTASATASRASPCGKQAIRRDPKSPNECIANPRRQTAPDSTAATGPYAAAHRE